MNNRSSLPSSTQPLSPPAPYGIIFRKLHYLRGITEVPSIVVVWHHSNSAVGGDWCSTPLRYFAPAEAVGETGLHSAQRGIAQLGTLLRRSAYIARGRVRSSSSFPLLARLRNWCDLGPPEGVTSRPNRGAAGRGRTTRLAAPPTALNPMVARAHRHPGASHLLMSTQRVSGL